MSDLVTKHCTPCTEATPRVSPDDVNRLLASLPGYKADMLVGSISKLYDFDDFYETMAFVNALAYIAHVEDHHPDLAVSYNRCNVTFTTHAIGGLSENDFICAAKIEALVRR
jgi:4a-hydroxytetrahydrobiopterin dehydratase